tara:strand:+ start:269 stop:1237 length:969 start_codon:yes stop_codon:yes gene_type:complete
MSKPEDRQEHSSKRGREAESPRSLPLRGWLDIGKRVFRNIGKKNLPIVAGGVALYWFLALFPLFIALFSVYGLVADPSQVEQQVDQFASALPDSAQEFLGNEMERLAGHSLEALGWGAILGIGIAIWSSARGVKGMMQSLNVVYEEKEERGIIKNNLVAMCLTAVILLLIVLAVGLIVALPIFLQMIGLGGFVVVVIQLVKWPILFCLVISVLGILYRWAPCRRSAEWKWITPGAMAASVLWIVGSVAFSFFVQNFGNYANTYGSLAAVIILILWFHLTAFIVLLGGVINGEMEMQTRHDSTIGEDLPMGERDAYVADNLGH